MNSSFINRLVGTSIVVLAAIVFIPNILDGEKVHHTESFPAIADKPEFATIDLQAEINAQAELAEMPSQPELENDQALDEDNTSYQASLNAPEMDAIPEFQAVEASEQSQAANTELSSTEAQPAKVEVTEPVLPKRNPSLEKTAYVIQLGSFSHKANVEALQVKLKAAGFDTFTRPVVTKNGTLTKVFVGPTTDKFALESKLPELKKLTKLNGRLTEFEPAK